MTSKKNRLLLWVAVLLMFSLYSLNSAVIWFTGENHSADFSLDLPAGWISLQEEQVRFTFSDPSQRVFLKIRLYDPGTHGSSWDLYEETSLTLGCLPESEGGLFLYNGQEAVFANLIFEDSQFRWNAYALFLAAPEREYVFISMTTEDLFDSYHDFLLSTLDSFAFNVGGTYLPGPVSQVLHQPDSDFSDRFTVFIEDSSYSLPYHPDDAVTSQDIVDREARLLSHYGGHPLALSAQERFYRVLYRDNHVRLDPLYQVISEQVIDPEWSKTEIARRILFWLQGFDYSRTNTLSDFLNPLDALVLGTGDCDTLGLIYLDLLHRFEIPAVLLISDIHKHAIVGVGVEYSGIKKVWNGVDFVVAELTAQIDLGLISQEMADMDDWEVFALPGYEQP